MTAEPLMRKHMCPRCKLGFIIFSDAYDRESTCLNCGYQVPSPPVSEFSELLSRLHTPSVHIP